MWEPGHPVATLRALSLLPQPPPCVPRTLGTAASLSSTSRRAPLPPSQPPPPPPGLPISLPVTCWNSFCAQQAPWRQTLRAFFPLRIDFTLQRTLSLDIEFWVDSLSSPALKNNAAASGLRGFPREACVPRERSRVFPHCFQGIFSSVFSVLAGLV